ncbi:MAG: phytoene/squalene synthase family protein, partial [Pseudomonadota bacterium]
MHQRFSETASTSSDRQIARAAAETIAKGSKSFAAAAKLFRKRSRHDVFMLYAWCRHCDDVTDGQDHGRGQAQQATIDTIQALRSNSLAAVRGQPCDELPFIALASVARRHHLPEWLIEDHLAGFEFDAKNGRPQTLDDLMRYCYQVAGSVGVMMAMIMGVHDQKTLYRANDLGLAFQLTNIARDIREDAERQRCYLPANWLAEHELRESDLTLAEHQQTAYRLAER